MSSTYADTGLISETSGRWASPGHVDVRHAVVDVYSAASGWVVVSLGGNDLAFQGSQLVGEFDRQVRVGTCRIIDLGTARSSATIHVADLQGGAFSARVLTDVDPIVEHEAVRDLGSSLGMAVVAAGAGRAGAVPTSNAALTLPPATASGAVTSGAFTDLGPSSGSFTPTYPSGPFVYGGIVTFAPAASGAITRLEAGIHWHAIPATDEWYPLVMGAYETGLAPVVLPFTLPAPLDLWAIAGSRSVGSTWAPYAYQASGQSMVVAMTLFLGSE